jgi:predicted ATP-grasp superfamily ATP-dependent carboligase
MKDHSCALILGGYVNGYSIIQELSENGVQDIVLFSTTREPGSYSNKIKKFVLIAPFPDGLLKEIQLLAREYHFIVVFPTDDIQLENLYAIYDQISDFCFIPFNKNNFPASLDKYSQYASCDALGVPRPKTIEIQTVEDIETISSIAFPVLIKPKTRLDEKIRIFRNLYLKNEQDLIQNKESLKNFVLAGVSFIASEIIPGDGSNIYAYVGYRNREGRILNEWTGKKLSQYPDDFGIFSSASNQAPVEVLEQGKTLLNGMNLMGIAEPEFKYDYRDGKYKLMEINLRSMMWNRVGYLSGVNIHYTQYMDAIGGEVPLYRQDKTKDIHLVCLKHELSNLIARKGYADIFYFNLFGGDTTNVALFDTRDLTPFLANCVDIFDEIIAVGRKRLGI